MTPERLRHIEAIIKNPPSVAIPSELLLELVDAVRESMCSPPSPSPPQPEPIAAVAPVMSEPAPVASVAVEEKPVEVVAPKRKGKR